MDFINELVGQGNFLADIVDKIAVLPLCEIIGRGPDQIRIFLVFLLQYPIGWTMHFLVHGTVVRHLFTLTLGILIQMYIYGFAILHVFLMTIVAYAMMILMPRDKSAPVVMLWVLAYLSYIKLSLMINNNYDAGRRMEIDAYTMLLVCKLSSLAYCYQDGATDSAKLNQDQRDRMITSLPTPLELASYVWYSQACAIGVFFEFSDYKRWIERRSEYANVPSPIVPSLIWLAKGLLCLVFFIIVSPYFNDEFCWSKDYTDHSIVYRVFYYYVAMTVKRFFYYNPFCMSCGAIIASGLGYNGVQKGDHQWNKIISVYIWEIETSSSPIEMLRFWNHQVHLWLKFYIMARLTPVGKRPGVFQNMVTFLVSALWHGFYPVYYIMFFLAAILFEVAKDIFKARSLFGFIPATLRPILGNFFSFLAMNYLGTLMNAKTFERGGAFLAATWYFVPIGLFVILGVSRSIGLVQIAQKMDVDANKANSNSPSSQVGGIIEAASKKADEQRFDDPKKTE